MKTFRWESMYTHKNDRNKIRERESLDRRTDKAKDRKDRHDKTKDNGLITS